ncbi:MAG TPA: hypothetical protein DCL62_07945 [Kandleria vitulina]|nr:hypothetical protein [Kandleria vitulina]
MNIRKNNFKKIVLMVILCKDSGDVNAKSRRVVIYRGSALMWTKDIVDFGYKNGKVTYSSGFQMNGWIFPNIATNKGIKVK